MQVKKDGKFHAYGVKFIDMMTDLELMWDGHLGVINSAKRSTELIWG